jgi:hypothetical protein
MARRRVFFLALLTLSERYRHIVTGRRENNPTRLRGGLLADVS